MGWFLKAFRSVVFLGWLCVVLAGVALSTTIWAVQASLAVTAAGASAAAATAKAVAKVKAKARLRRVVAAIPVGGVVAVGWFEEQDYQEWLAENPGGTRGQYGCEVAAVTGEVIAEVLQDLPEAARPSEEAVLARLPKCGE